jgi:uncharacterized membrane protein
VKVKGINALLKFWLVIISIILITALLQWIAVIAKPVAPNPDQTGWPSGTSWGTVLHFENSDNASNTSISEVWFGVGASEKKVNSPPDPSDGIIVEFYDGTKRALWVKADAPHENYPVRFRSVTSLLPQLPGGTISVSTWENADTRFVPQDFSVVLEVPSLSLTKNLRKENAIITGLDVSTKSGTLYLDNAVNIQSIENLDPLYGKPGDNLRLRVTVKNTGRYTDNYVVSSLVNGILDPATITNLAPGNQDNVILSMNLPAGTNVPIVVTAAGNYATDQDYVTASGLMVKKVQIGITPNINFGENGAILTFDVLVKNIGDFPDNYSLTVENIWEASLSSTQLDNVNPGENRHVTLSVKIPDDATPGASDNITVTVTSLENVNVNDNATCTARMGSYSVAVSILPSYQDNAPGGTLNYTVVVSNTGTLNDSYNLTFIDNIDGSNYWEDNISLENSSLTVPVGEFRTTLLVVTIPDNAPTGTNDLITVIATSQADITIFGSDSCIANVARLSITISPEYQSGLPGVTLTYTVDIKNNENADGDYYSVVTDNLGWKLAFGIKRMILYPFGEIWTSLKVTISENAIGGTDDNVTVTMVSMDNTVRYSASCVAHVIIVRGVKVSITPGENMGPPGATLGYTVTVNNTGNVEDNYGLTASDDAVWGLEFLPPNLIIPPRGSENAVLNVTIPENAAALILDNIIVTATSQENENVSAENSCTALSLAVSELNLVPGWNLVGFSFTSEYTTPRNVFPGLSYPTDYIIYWWNAPIGPYVIQGVDQVLQDNIGYWVYINQNKTIKTSGIPPDNRDIYLLTGWNIVHFPVVDNNTTPKNILAGLTYPTDYIIYWWDAPIGPYVIQGVNQVFQDNLGYWIYLDQNRMITVP